MSTVNGGWSVPFQGNHHARMCLHILCESDEGFDVANVNLSSTIFRIDHDLDCEIRRLFFDEKVNLAFNPGELANNLGVMSDPSRRIGKTELVLDFALIFLPIHRDSIGQPLPKRVFHRFISCSVHTTLTEKTRS